MPKNKVLQRASVNINASRNDFDRSYIQNYASFAGRLDVCMMQPVVANTKGRINRATFTRTAKVVSPSFTHVTEHFDFFLVPIKSIWSLWEAWKTQTNDVKSSSLRNILNGRYDGSGLFDLPDNCPRMNIGGHIISKLSNDGNFNRIATVGYANDALSLLEECNYGNIATLPSDQNCVVNALPLAAYHKVYYEHYRNTAYEGNDMIVQNLDWSTTGTSNQLGNGNGYLPDVPSQIFNSSGSAAAFYKRFFAKHYVNYRNDYFNNVYPSLNYSLNQFQSQQGLAPKWSVPAAVVQGGLTTGTYQDPDYPTDPFIYPVHEPAFLGNDTAYTGRIAFDSSGQSSDASLLNFVSFSQPSVQSIRAAFALDKLARAAAYAPKHIKDQYKAQFGVDVSEDKSLSSSRLGSFESEVYFQEVTQMATTGEGSLGELGAKGIGSDGMSKDIEFYAEHDSLIVGIHYIMPRAMYDANGLNPFNQAISISQFYQKAFENLGLRPFYSWELDIQNIIGQHIIGFTVPNQHLKLGIDRNMSVFKRNTPVVYRDDREEIVANDGLSSELRNFTTHAKSDKVSSLSVLDGVNYEYFKVSPLDLNYIFALQQDGQNNPMNCQFFGEYRIKFYTVAPLSVHGQPTL